MGTEATITIDEYQVAADYLEDGGFDVVAASLREMRDRVLQAFTNQETAYRANVNLTRPYTIDGWQYFSDGRIAVRLQTTASDTNLREIDRGPFTLRRILEVWGKLWKPCQAQAGDWLPFPPLPDVIDDEGGYHTRITIEQRDISAVMLRKILLLPNPEYLSLFDDDARQPPPLLFRFSCGEGIAMPMKPSEEFPR